MYCPSCGQSNPDEAKFCGKCGAPMAAAPKPSHAVSGAAKDTGEEVKGNRGKPVPIGIGRFDYGAVKLPASFETGHPFRSNFQGGSPSEDEKIYTNIALFPGLWGLKFPMMPTIHVASKWRRIEEDGTAENRFSSFPYQSVFLFGSRKSSPALPVVTGVTGGLWSERTQRFPGFDTSIPASAENRLFYSLLWTWQESET